MGVRWGASQSQWQSHSNSTESSSSASVAVEAVARRELSRAPELEAWLWLDEAGTAIALPVVSSWRARRRLHKHCQVGALELVFV